MSILQALCNYNGLLYAAWKGEAGDERLFYSSFNGSGWAPAGQIPGNSSVGPSLAVLGAAMYAAWKGEGADERLFCSKFTAAAGWAQATQIQNVASSTGPAIAAMGNRLYAVWKGMGIDQGIYHSSSADGVNWTPQTPILNVATSVAPSLAFIDNRLYVAWKGMNNDQGIYYSSSVDGVNWTAQNRVPNVASSVGPSLAGFNGKLYAAWKGATGDEGIWYASFDLIGNWSAQARIPNVASSMGPALADYEVHPRLSLHPVDRLYAMWKGANADQQLWYASFEGTNWSAQATVPGNTGQDLPQNIGLRMQYQETNLWCWIAVATSINHFYNPASTATQCGIMTTVGQNKNGFPKNTSACPSATAIAAVPGLAAILANPYTPDAENVLQTLVTPTEYIKPGGVGDALNIYGNWNNSSNPTLTLDLVTNELAAGRPICADILWNNGTGQHCVAIAGVLDDQLLICDPVSGEIPILFELFPSAYQGGASLVSVALTQNGS